MDLEDYGQNLIITKWNLEEKKKDIELRKWRRRQMLEE